MRVCSRVLSPPTNYTQLQVATHVRVLSVRRMGWWCIVFWASRGTTPVTHVAFCVLVESEVMRMPVHFVSFRFLSREFCLFEALGSCESDAVTHQSRNVEFVISILSTLVWLGLF